jgi:tripartite-type tricarboxylate transporter receptor subunit TctC
MNRREAVLAMLALGAPPLAAMFAVPAIAQSWPAKPIRLIAPYPPGGPTDIVSRYLAEKLRPVLGQTVLVENKPGAQGIIGTEAAKNSPPDGYTFVYLNASIVCINPYIYDKLPYDALHDFAPVTQLGATRLAMVVPAALRMKTLADFIAYAKANPGTINFASFGIGSSSHIYGEMLKSLAGIEMTHVPYKGAGPAVQDIMAGHATMGIQDLAAVGPLVRSGNLVALAVTGLQRWPLFPHVPTFAEQGVPDRHGDLAWDHGARWHAARDHRAHEHGDQPHHTDARGTRADPQVRPAGHRHHARGVLGDHPSRRATMG